VGLHLTKEQSMAKKEDLKKNTTKTVKPGTKEKTKLPPPDNLKKGTKVVKNRK
jgi:hypothetical protein